MRPAQWHIWVAGYISGKPKRFRHAPALPGLFCVEIVKIFAVIVAIKQNMLDTRPETVKTGKKRYDILVFNETRNHSQEILLVFAKFCLFFGENAESARNIRKTLEYIYI